MEQKSERIRIFFDVLNRWMFMKNNDENVGDYLKKENIKSLAIYGMGDMARHLINELKSSECSVEAVLDCKEAYYYGDIRTVQLEKFETPVDLIVYTDPFESEETIEKLSSTMKCKVCSIQDLVFFAF